MTRTHDFNSYSVTTNRLECRELEIFRKISYHSYRNDKNFENEKLWNFEEASKNDELYSLYQTESEYTYVYLSSSSSIELHIMFSGSATALIYESFRL